MLRQFFFLLFLLPTYAFALDVEVEVAERGANATEARTKAMSAAERQAFEKILGERLPQKGKELAQNYDAQAISQMVQGYEIIEEKMTPDTYRAKMKVKFEDSAIDKIVGAPAVSPDKEAEVAAAVATSRSVLLLPVWFDEKGILLWETGNEWRNAVNAVALQAEAGQWIAPFGDPTDMLTVDSAQIETANFAKLAPLAARYGAGSILVATAKPGEGILAVELRHLTPAGEEKEVMTVEAKDNATSPGELLKQAADELLLGSEYKDPAALTGAQKAAMPERDRIMELHQINLLLHLKQARDWAELNHRLHTIPGVEKLEVVVADWQRMQMRMAFRGDPEDLGEALAKAGLNVQQSADMLLISIR